MDAAPCWTEWASLLWQSRARMLLSKTSSLASWLIWVEAFRAFGKDKAWIYGKCFHTILDFALCQPLRMHNVQEFCCAIRGPDN